MRGIRFAVGLVALSLTLLLAGLVCVATLLPVATGWHRVALTSGSMAPGINPGDIVIADPDVEHPLDVGTVIVFADSSRPGLVTHRVVEVGFEGGYRTKGDANADPDVQPVLPDAVLGEGRVMVPFVGAPSMWMHHGQRGLALFSIAAVGLLMWLCRYGIQDRFDPWQTPTAPPAAAPAAQPPGGTPAGSSVQARRPRTAAMALTLVVAAVVAMPVMAKAAFSGTTVNSRNYLAMASGTLTYYLKTDAPGDTTSSPVLPLASSAPTLTTLYNYDTDRDDYPGLTLAKTKNLKETDSSKIQKWDLSTSSALKLSGPATLRMWSVMKDFNTTKDGAVEVGLFDCDGGGSSCTEIATSSVRSRGGWSGGSRTWVAKDFDLGTLSHTVAAGRVLQVRMIVQENSEDEMWFAYDTTAYPSSLEVG